MKRLLLALAAAVAGLVCRGPVNVPPDAPATPAGPDSGGVGSEYEFVVSTADPDGDSVCFRFDWGDGDTSDWGAAGPTGAPDTGRHEWFWGDTFLVRAQAKDAGGVRSAWSSTTMFACSGWPPFPCILLDTVWLPTDEGEGEPLGAALSPDGEHLYVACNGPDSLVKIRTSDNTLEGLIPLPGYAWDVCVHPSGRYVYVSGYNHLGDWVWVVSADGDSVCAEVRLGGSGRVEPLPDGRYVYVASEDVDSVWAIETQGNTVVAWLPADGEPIELVARQDGEFVYAACCAGSIVTIRTSDNTVTDVQPSPYETMGLALSPDGTYGFVPVQEDIDCIAVRDLAGRYDVNRIALSDAVWPGRVGLLPGGDYLLSCAGVEEWPALMVVRLADSAAVAYLEFEFDWGFPAEPVDFVASASGERLYVVDWLNMLVLVLGTPGSSGSGRPVPRVTLTRPGPRPRLAAVSARRGR